MIKDKFDAKEVFSCPFLTKLYCKIWSISFNNINIMIKDKFDFKESFSCPFTEEI